MSDDRVTDYAEDVLAGRELAGPHVRGAALRHLRDLERPDLIYDEGAAHDAIDFYEDVLFLSAGEFEGKPFILLPWQAFCVGSLYGWFMEIRGVELMRFRKSYLETGKGSGKTPLVAGMGIKSICADGEARAECYVLARNKDQTAVTFRAACAMIEQSPALSARLITVGGRDPDRIVFQVGASFMERVSSDSQGKGKSGPIASRVICDEYHEHDSDKMLEFYEAGFKQRKNPLTVITTNAGVSLTSPCGKEHTYAVRVAEGEIENDRYFSYVCAMDPDDDPFTDPTCWPKTNPSMPLTPTLEYVEEQTRKAVGMPSKRSVVDRLQFCRWVEAEAPWIDPAKWDACEVEPEAVPAAEKLREAPSYLGLDLSLKTDLTACARVWDLGEYLFAKIACWMPEDRIEAHADRDEVPYVEWAADGFLQLCPGHTIKYDFVAKWMIEQTEDGNVVGVAFDPHKIDALEEALEDAGSWTSREPDGGGLWMVPHPQGFMGETRRRKSGRWSSGEDKKREEFKLWMPRSIDACEEAILDGRLKVLYNPVVRIASRSAIVIQDASENRRFNKQKVVSRIDPIVALTQAIGFTQADGVRPKDGTFIVPGLYDERE